MSEWLNRNKFWVIPAAIASVVILCVCGLGGVVALSSSDNDLDRPTPVEIEETPEKDKDDLRYEPPDDWEGPRNSDPKPTPKPKESPKTTPKKPKPKVDINEYMDCRENVRRHNDQQKDKLPSQRQYREWTECH